MLAPRDETPLPVASFIDVVVAHRDDEPTVAVLVLGATVDRTGRMIGVDEVELVTADQVDASIEPAQHPVVPTLQRLPPTPFAHPPRRRRRTSATSASRSRASSAIAYRLGNWPIARLDSIRSSRAAIVDRPNVAMTASYGRRRVDENRCSRNSEEQLSFAHAVPEHHPDDPRAGAIECGAVRGQAFRHRRRTRVDLRRSRAPIGAAGDEPAGRRHRQGRPRRNTHAQRHRVGRRLVRDHTHRRSRRAAQHLLQVVRAGLDGPARRPARDPGVADVSQPRFPRAPRRGATRPRRSARPRPHRGAGGALPAHHRRMGSMRPAWATTADR